MRVRDERGVVFPSPVVMLSIVAVAMAGIAYVATQGQDPTEREIISAAQPAAPADPQPTFKPEKIEKKKPAKPPVRRNRVYVEVYNNSGITGLAGRYAQRAGEIGWRVVGSDNWYGTIPASTVYFPEKLEREGKLLALDLGIRRVMPAVDGPMKSDRLTVVLTADAAS
ncbi:LytR C-terminal domain-containing protein [Nocardioides sp. GCM10027113]|uniref:LytR C-terminal domain-containing protein n=1 Tax=unclassified Nocardioides TaxID=2615069 RepID=UPI003608782B